MPILSMASGYAVIFLFAVLMFSLTLLVSRDREWKTTGVGFLAAGREVTWPVGATSIAASWLWAPALFVSVQKTYELGIPGLFWFTAPNILALVIFAWMAPRIRAKIPGGYTLPDWIRYRLDNKMLHKVYLIPYIWYQIMAVCVQIFVGGLMLNYLTGIPLNIVMFLLLAIGLSYSLVSGLRASMITDFIQMVFVGFGLLIIIPWIWIRTGSEAVSGGFGGIAGNTNILDPKVAFSFGIVTSIGLIAGAISDQQYWQRSFAIKEDQLVRAFVWGGLLFGIVPIALSVLGFLAANPAVGIEAPQGTGLPMIGVAAVATLLPKAAAVFFVIMLLAGLCSTLDSGLCASSSLYAIDMAPLSAEERAVLHKERLGIPLDPSDLDVKKSLDRQTMGRARTAMFAIAFIGLITAFIVQHLFSLDRLWWIFNGVASCFVVPTVLSVFWDRLSAKGALYGILGSLLGMVGFVYGNWVKSDPITVGSAVFIIVISLIFCAIFRRQEPWSGYNLDNGN